MYSPYANTALQYQQNRLYGAANTQLQNSRYSADYYDDYDYSTNYNNYNSLNSQNLYNRQGQFNRVQQNAGLNRRMGGGGGTNMRTAAAGLHGSYSDDYCDNGISIGLLLTAALGIAVMFYTLYTKITMARRRKRSAEEDIDTLKFGLEHITDFFYSGNNLFF